MKTSVDRIHFYTKKANEYGEVRFDLLRGQPGRQISCYRFPRLMQYKSALAENLRKERDEANRVRLVFQPVPVDYDPFDE